jgi:membrane-associated phospholipid phosphatase
MVVAAVAALAVAALTALVVAHPFLAADAAVARAVQATDWGPATLLFAALTWVGFFTTSVIVEGVLFVLVLLLNRPAWRLVAASVPLAGWTVGLGRLVLRPRPTLDDVLRVTERHTSPSYPSGHVVFFATVGALLMLCLGRRYLPRRARPLGWALVTLVVAAGAIGRIYAGAHWPSDVLAGLLLATAWLALVAAVPWRSERASERAAPA